MALAFVGNVPLSTEWDLRLLLLLRLESSDGYFSGGNVHIIKQFIPTAHCNRNPERIVFNHFHSLLLVMTLLG